MTSNVVAMPALDLKVGMVGHVSADLVADDDAEEEPRARAIAALAVTRG